MSFLAQIKKKIMQLFKIQPAEPQSIYIQEDLSLENYFLLNRIIYRGKANELRQMFSQIPDNNTFWGNVLNRDRKVHIPLPASIIDYYSNTITADINDISITDEKINEIYNEIAKDNNLLKVIENALKQTLIVGDGAFKVSYDTAISKYPIVEFIPGDFVDYKYNRGRLQEVIFYTDLKENKKNYRLAEIYGYGYINYELFDEYGNKIDMSITEQTSNIQNITFDNQIIMAIPFKIFESVMFVNRGKGLLSDKIEIIDSLDEVASEWLSAVRKGKVIKYLPESLIPRNPETGSLDTYNFDFRTEFVKIAGSMEEGKDQIQVIQPDIDYQAFNNSYKAYLDMFLQGVVSPATLGIDLAVNSTAESQREKEKITIQTRSKITAELTEVLKQLVNTLLNTYNIANDTKIQQYEVSVSFGEYASTDFASVIDAVSKAHQSGIMSIEQAVEELYGDTLTEQEKADEVKRIKDEQGYEELDPDLVGDSEEVEEETDTEKRPTVSIDGEKIKELAEQLGRKELKDIYSKLP